MNKWMNRIFMVCMFGVVGNIYALDDFLIENQRTNLMENATWGDTYVGKYTDENILVVQDGATLESADAFVGFSDTASSNTVLIAGDGSEWSMGNLQVGSESNSYNQVVVWSNGVVEIANSLSILGVTNGNQFILGDGGTLKMGSDFDAALAGFSFESNGTLSVAGTLSNMDNVEGSRHLVLTGENAAWLRSTNTVHIGANSSGNSLTIDDGAQFEFTNLVVGAVGTESNLFTLSSGSMATINSNLTLAGQDSAVNLEGEAFIGEDLSITGTSNLFSVSSGSMATINSNLTLAGQDNAVNLEGEAFIGGNLSITGISNLFTVGGTTKVMGDIDSNTGIQFSGGTLEAYGTVNMESIDGNGSMLLTGDQARWTNNTTISIGASIGGTTLLVQSNALIRADTIVVTSSEVILTDGGTMDMARSGSFLTNSSITVEDEGKLIFGFDLVESNFFIGNSSIAWSAKGIIEFQGAAPIIGGWDISAENNYTELGTLFLNDGRQMIVNGANAYWDAAINNLHVGDLSSDNTLVISNGAWAAVKSMTIGDFSEMGGSDNLVLISGAGTSVTSLNHTVIGGALLDFDNGDIVQHQGGNGNVLRVEDGASFYSPGTLHNRNATGTSGLEIASGAVVDVNNYYQGSGAYLTILTDSSGINTGLLRANTAEFEAGAKVGVDAISKLEFDLIYTNSIVEANTMIIGGSTNGTSADLAMLNASGGSLVKYNLMLEGGTNIVATYSRNYITDSAGFDPDSIIAGIADEIDLLASQGNAAASNQVEILDTMTGEQQSQQMEQMYIYGLPTFMHNQGVFGGIDQVRARGEAKRSSSSKPSGAAGPHAADQGLLGWVKVYGGFGSRDEDGSGAGFKDGYNVQSYGTVVGVDQAFGSLLFGLAGGYAGSTIEGDNNDQSDATTGYGLVYANYGVDDWFGDLVVSYGLTDIDNQSGTEFGATSSIKASQTAFFIGGGNEAIDEASGTLFRSSLGLQVSQFAQDEYSEISTSVGKDVEAYDRMSYQSKVGVSIMLPTENSKVKLESEIRAFWLHEFNTDEEFLNYTLIDSTQPGQFIMRSPDQDVGLFGFGMLSKWDSGLQLRMDVDGQLSKTYYSVTVSGGLLYEF